MSLSDDPRWQRLHDPSWVCVQCGQPHGGLFDLGLARPDIWSGDNIVANEDIDPDGHCLSADLCVLEGQHYFVRGIVLLPIVGGDGEAFGYGVWSSLSRANFDRYLAAFDSGPTDPDQAWFGWFANALKGYPDTINLKCRVRPQKGGMRPLIELEPTDHPLAVEQAHGITLDRIFDIYAANGHVLKPAE